MFDNNKTNNQTEIKQTDGVSMPSNDINDGDIYTMPDKFSQPKKTSNKKYKLLIVVGGLVVVLALVIVGIIYLLSGSVDDNDNNSYFTNEPIVNIPPANNENNNEEPVEEDNTSNEEKLDTPAKRDEQRLKDIVTLRSALALYYQDNQAYPDVLEDLVNDYLTELPSNPSPGGASYLYRIKNQNQDYTITFTLENGGKLGSLNLKAGDYKAGPSVIEPFLPDSEEDDDTNENEDENNNDEDESEETYIMGLDSDNDGLTDIEENLYGTDSALVDTDNDGYSDATEVVNVYSGLSGPGDRLAKTDRIEEYYNTKFNYVVFKPQAWTVRELTENKREVLLNSATTEYIQILIQDNPLGLPVKEWYKKFNPEVETLKDLVVADNVAVQTEDGLRTYVGRGSYIYAIVYNLGTSNQLNYLATYRMVLKSFDFVDLVENKPEDIRDDKRLADVRLIKTALDQYKVDKIDLPEFIDDNIDTNQVIGTKESGCDVQCGDREVLAQCINLKSYLVPDYIEDIPTDPLVGSELYTGYYVNLIPDGTIVVGACQPEVSEKIIANE